MSFVGSLDDVSVSDVLQFIHLGGRSGTLTLSVDDRKAEIGFHRGRIISARGHDHIPLGEWLLVQGALPHADIEAALRVQRRMRSPAPLGKLLVDMGFITLEQLTEQLQHQIEETVYSVIGWTGGSFEFELDTLRPIDDMAVSPGDILPPIRINTQTILLEAARILDERNRADREKKTGQSQAPGAAPTASDEWGEADPFGDPCASAVPDMQTEAIGPATAAPIRVQVVSTDHELRSSVQLALGSGPATVVGVSAREAGTRLPGEAAPVVLVDLRGGDIGLELLSSIRRVRPGATLLGVAADTSLCAEAQARGALAVVTPDPQLLAACIRNVQRCRDDGADAARTHATRMKSIAKLSRVFGEFRSGLLNATVSINLMNLVSESVERAVLFVVAPTRLVVLGAYGETSEGRSLSHHTRLLQLPLTAAGALADSVIDARSRTLTWDDSALPPSFAALLGRPASGSYTVFPLLGSRRVIATLYVDNGRKHTPIDDVEFLEIATSQVGLYYENELLRRQLRTTTQE